MFFVGKSWAPQLPDVYQDYKSYFGGHENPGTQALIFIHIQVHSLHCFHQVLSAFCKSGPIFKSETKCSLYL